MPDFDGDLGSAPPPARATRRPSTVIFLHGRGSNARKFAGPLLASLVHGHRTLRDALPHTKFIFPTAPLARATKYRRSVIHQWYDGSGDWEPEARGDMRHSIEHIHDLVRQEVRALDGAGAGAGEAAAARRIVLAGISQGCAMALMSMLLWDGSALGAVVGICGFMPLNAHLTALLGGGAEDGTRGSESDDDLVVFAADDAEDEEDTNSDQVLSPLQRAVADLREEAELDEGRAAPSPLSFLSTPVFIGHGTDDQKVEFQHGEQAAALLRLMGLDVDFHEYQGLGHWYSAEMLEHIVNFLADKGGLDQAIATAS
ncbi:Acyl-protein thioesterase 1 [Escovopsis weberi]|uniref:Acyl-protein thioesterase 1 n=1 Tax=Escovopsis weberi TaxID=150374 RepID=A0A0N0RU73_ESCWE|nr:Acyl-protein thioesterase 1 [Escovopsis weberi]